MANRDEHDIFLEMIDERLQELDDLPEKNEMVSTTRSEIPKQQRGCQEAKDSGTSTEALKKSREEAKRMLINFRTTLVAKLNINRKIMKEAREGNKGEVATDVRDQLKMRATKLEDNLYHLFTQVMNFFPRREEEATCYDEFKACLKRLLDPGNKVVRAIMERLKEDKKQARDGRADELLFNLLGHIHIVACIVDVVGCANQDSSSWGSWIKEREEVQKEIELKINALKGI